MASFRDRIGQFFGERRPAQPMQQQSVPGFSVYGGYVNSGETNSNLIGRQRWITASDILANVSIVAASVRFSLNLIARPSWRFDPPDDTAEAKAAAEFMDSVLDGIDTSWTRIIRRAGIYRYHGFGIHEWVAKRREEDGKIGLKSLVPVPGHTVEKWDYARELRGVGQIDPQTGQELYLPRRKMLYLVDDTLTDRPDGMGWFRHLVDPSNRLKSLLELEAVGFERDLAGIPVGRAPLDDMNKAVRSGALKAEDRDRQVTAMRDLIKIKRKSSETGIILDSSTYPSKTDSGVTPSSTPLWDLQLLDGSQNSIAEMGDAIKRTAFDMAMIMGTTSLLIGREGEGSRALSEDVSRNMYLTANSTLADMAEAVNRDIVDVIWTMNGLPEKLKPKANPEDVAFKDANQIAQTLADMANAGAILAPDDPAVNDLRDLMGLPHAPEIDVGMLNALQGRPDPTKPSPDAQLNDERSREQMANDNERRAQEERTAGGQPPPGKTKGSAARKASKETLYVSRPLLNADELIAWAKANGFGKTVPANEMHVTVAFSREPVDWGELGDSFDNLRDTGGNRKILALGDGSAIVLAFELPELEDRWEQIIEAGASWDWPAYQPHVTITYDGAGMDISEIEPYDGPLEFGPEKFAKVNDDWKATITEKALFGELYASAAKILPAAKAYNPDQPRAPKGSGNGGQWIDASAHLAGNPLNPSETLVGDLSDPSSKIGGLTVRDAGDDTWHLSDLRSITRGGGRKAMEELTRLADEHGKRLELFAVPLDSPAGKKMTAAKLRKWYSEFGFQREGQTDFMVREPWGTPSWASRGAKSPLRLGSNIRVVGMDKRYNPNQPRDPKGSPTGGRWTSTGAGAEGEAEGKVVPMTAEARAEAEDGQRGKTLEELHEMAIENQAKLAKLGAELESELGLDFVDPGVKNINTAREKLTRPGENYEGPHQLTDLARGSFVVDSPEDADRVISELAKKATVYDKGWKRLKGTNYIDRKLIVRYENGGLAELQLVPRGIYQAKFEKGGHNLYEMSRSGRVPRGQAILFIEVQRAMYQSAVSGTPFAELGG